MLKLVLLAVATLTSASGVVEKSQVTPVQKVLELMQGMLEKGKKEKHDEQVQFAAYKQFCDDTTVDKQRAIKEAERTIEVLKADIEKAIATASKLSKEIAGLETDIAHWAQDQKAATEVRGLEKSDYSALHKDYSESVDALSRAIAVLKKQAHNRKQAESLAQVSNLQSLSLIPEEAKRALDSFLQQDDEPLDVKAPEAHGYEFQSHGIVEMLEKLSDKFVAERTAAEKTEMNAKHAFDMLMQDLAAQIEQATTDRDTKAEEKGQTLQAKADAEGDLRDTTTTMEADKAYLSNLMSTCESKATDFESRQELRAEELEAIRKAVSIIASGSVSGNADKHLPSFLQTRLRHRSLVMLRATPDNTKSLQERAAQFLQSKSQAIHSRVLSTVAAHMAADPFAKVKKLIKDLVVRLMEEANEEAEHKGWCDKELATNLQTRKEKTQAVETLHAEIDELNASISKLTEDIAAATKAVAELDAAMAEATDLRQKEKATNEETISDAQEGQAALAQALVVLKEFYAKAGQATALVQQQPDAPEIFDSPYTGMQSENGGVIGMLEVIESDFARLEVNTKTAEQTAQQQYDKFITESKVDKAAKTQEIEHKTTKKQDETQGLTVKTEDLEGTQKELDASLAYFDKLKPSCVDAGVSYEDRVARRKEEIQSLQEALRILNGEEIA